jgi:hypothetical protein
MRTETRTAPPTFPGGDPISYTVKTGPGGWQQDGPRTRARRAAYAKRRALLGTDDGRNDMVDMCRVLTGMSMVRRANLDRKRGVRR